MSIPLVLIIRFGSIIFLSLLTTGCTKYSWESEHCIGVDQPGELPSIIRQAMCVEKGLISLGFRRVALTDEAKKCLVELKGDYKHLTDLSISISCPKQIAPGRSVLEIQISSPYYQTDAHFGEGDELDRKIDTFLKEGKEESEKEGS